MGGLLTFDDPPKNKRRLIGGPYDAIRRINLNPSRKGETLGSRMG